MIYSYFAFGLLIDSELELPELTPAEAGAAAISIRLGMIEWEPAVPSGDGRCAVEVEPNKICFYWPSVGKFIASDGREIVIDPLIDSEQSLIRILVLNAVMSAVLHQRGLLLLHASGLRLGDDGIVFMGEKGEGKSTLAASMQLDSGNCFEMVADDIVAISISESNSWILPAFPQFRLWPDAIKSFRLDLNSLASLHPQFEKLGYRAAGNFALHPVRLRSIYVLHTGSSTNIELLNPKEAFLELTRHSYLGRHIKSTGLITQHFKDCSHLANSVPVARLRRPRSLQLLPELGNMIANDLARATANGQHRVLSQL